ncbi:MAG: FixH family protein, partial [Thiothrix sp.]|nr:FixH family protein [Thiothrix sp.]
SQITYKDGRLNLNLTDHENRMIDHADVTAYITRPVQDGVDFSLPLSFDGKGHYVTSVSFPLPGQWDITVSVQWQNQQYQAHTRIVAP